jgi:hypothetical protein
MPSATRVRSMSERTLGSLFERSRKSRSRRTCPVGVPRRPSHSPNRVMKFFRYTLNLKSSIAPNQARARVVVC